MRISKIILVCFLFAAFTGCKKDAVEVNPDLEGKWISEIFDSHSGTLITIHSAGDSEVKGRVQNETILGKAKIKDDELKIGPWKAKIIRYPGYDAGGSYLIETSMGKYYAARFPVNASATVSGSGVVFSWDYYDGDLGNKIVDYRLLPSGNWITVSNQQLNMISVSGLATGTYEWRMKTVYENHSSLSTTAASFVIQ